MRRFIKRTCAVALCAILAIEVMPKSSFDTNSKVEVSAYVDYDGEFKYSGRMFHYRYDGSNIKLVYVEGSGDMILPSTINENGVSRKVTGLEYPFGHQQNIKSISVPDTVTKIGDDVFANSKIGKIKLSSNLETIGSGFCNNSSVDEIICDSKKIKSIGKNACNKMAKKTVVIGDWLIRCGTSQNVLDLSTKELKNVKHVVDGAYDFGKGVNTLRLGDNDALVKARYFKNECSNYIANVYINDKYIKPTSARDTVPKIISDNDDAFRYSYFSHKYASEKAKYVLNSMGLTYYGPNYSFFKGTLGAKKEYEALIKIHDYIVKNYTFNGDATGSFYTVFNGHTETKCEFDSQMMAFLLEYAGVEAETVYSREFIPVKNEAEKQQILKKEPKAEFTTYDGNIYKLGYCGAHAWNVVKIGGNDYFIDATNNRQLKWNSFLFFSDKYVNHILKTSECIHAYSRYSNYPLYISDEVRRKTMFFFQDSKPNEEKVCKKSIGDVDMNCYTNQSEDADMLEAYCKLSQSIKNKIASTKDANKLSPSELEAMNAGKIKLVDTSNKNYKFLFSYEDMDVNFDGKIDTSDVSAIRNRLEIFKNIK